MGVPKLFKIILDKFPKSHSKVDSKIKIDYFFIDFNQIIYSAYEKLKADTNIDTLYKLKKDKIEDKIIHIVVDKTTELINLVSAQKLVYIAFDGSVPRGKMVQQRDRRYKKILENEIKRSLQQKYGSEPRGEPWNTTNISPGTTFMLKVSSAIQKAIMTGIFPTRNEYILSDTTVFGEGEHKFLKYLEQLPGSNVCIYSNDGDLLMLVNRFIQHNIYLLTKPKETSRVVQKFYSNEKYIYVVIRGLDDGFRTHFSKIIKLESSEPIDLIRLKKDYIFFTFLGGNDFVQHIYFLRMKDEHTFKVLKGIYQALYPKHGYLIDDSELLNNNNNTTINHKTSINNNIRDSNIRNNTNNQHKIKINQEFLLDYFRLLARQELRWLKEKQKQFQNSKPSRNKTAMQELAKMEPWEREWQNFEHTYFYKRNHPLYDELKDQFNKIDYTLKPNKLWKGQYYDAFFNVNYADKKQINRICFQYLQSLVFCLHYYLDELPSYTWYYPYHASPLPSDILRTLERVDDINEVFKFNKGRPYRPLEQLLLILPPQNDLLSNEIKNKVMKKFPEYYPQNIDLDVLWGQKYIYSEPVLPDINVHQVLKQFNQIKLSKKDQELNKVYDQPLYFPVS